MPIPVDDPRDVALARVWAYVNAGTEPTLEELRVALQGTTPPS